MERKEERLKELLVLTECYKQMIEKKQMTEEELKAALDVVKKELDEVK